MKHKFSIITATLSAALCLVPGLAGCKPNDPTPEACEHEYGDDWIQGPETHWRECLICHEKFVEATHTFRNVVGQSYTVYNSKNAPIPLLKVSAEGDPREILIKEVWVCTESETASLRISYSTSSEGTFAGSVEIPVGSYGWVKAGEFPGGGLVLSTYSFFRLQASVDDMNVQEIVFLASRAGEEETLFLLTPALFGATGQEGNRQKALIDAQQFPKEKRECYVCHYPEPKAEK